ncbi:MAG: MFS transporter [Pseudomonadota bacterium]
MLDILKERTFRHLFLAQILALVGTGLASVALGLLAYDLAGGSAALVLGAIFAVKMVANVVLAPIAAALAALLPRRRMLVTLDLIRAGAALCLPFASELWQVFGLVIVLQSASAGFTPTFQATIPDILPEEERYTRALSLSRLAYDLEAMLSPALAALVLLTFAYDTLFLGTAAGFVASAMLIISVILPRPAPSPRRGFYDRTTRGIRIYLATPRLRGLLAFSFAVSAVGAMVLVNTVVLVRGELGFGEGAVAIALAAFGTGSMVAALALPSVLDRLTDRWVMTAGGMLMLGALAGLSVWQATVGLGWNVLMLAWFIAGLGCSAILTPSGRLLRRSSQPDDRPAIFAAQFALSHACWLVTYPLAGWLMTFTGLSVALNVLTLMTAAALVVAVRQWPARDSETMVHSHPDLPKDHPHLRGGQPHSHVILIDDLHPSWPGKG